MFVFLLILRKAGWNPSPTIRDEVLVVVLVVVGGVVHFGVSLREGCTVIVSICKGVCV